MIFLNEESIEDFKMHYLQTIGKVKVQQAPDEIVEDKILYINDVKTADNKIIGLIGSVLENDVWKHVEINLENLVELNWQASSLGFVNYDFYNVLFLIKKPFMTYKRGYIQENIKIERLMPITPFSVGEGLSPLNTTIIKSIFYKQYPTYHESINSILNGKNWARAFSQNFAIKKCPITERLFLYYHLVNVGVINKKTRMPVLYKHAEHLRNSLNIEVSIR